MFVAKRLAQIREKYRLWTLAYGKIIACCADKS